MFTSEFQVSWENRRFKFVLTSNINLRPQTALVEENIWFLHQLEVTVEHPHSRSDLNQTRTISVVRAIIIPAKTALGFSHDFLLIPGIHSETPVWIV